MMEDIQKNGMGAAQKYFANAVPPEITHIRFPK